MKNIIYILIIASTVLISCKNKKESIDGNSPNHPENVKSDNNDDGKISITKAQFESSNMKLGSLTERDFPKIIKTTGMIDAPPQSIEIINSFYGGFIKKSNLLIGDKVRKGQRLVTIENPAFIDMQQKYLEIKEQLTYLKSEYQRQKTLYEEQITSEKMYLKSESDYKHKTATLKGLRKKLEMLNINISNLEQGNMVSSIAIYSSISGSISKINVSKGTHISPADEIMEIINTDHIHIELKVFEKDAMKIKKGQHIRFKVSEITDTYYDAEVHLVGKLIDENSRTVKVHGHLHSDTKNKFNIGMFVDAEIETESNKAFAVPIDAVIEDGEQQIVLILEKKDNENFVFKTIKVEIGSEYNGFIEILSKNILNTDQVLINGSYLLVGE